MIIYKKHFLLLANINSELLTLMPAILAYSASFPPCRLAYDSWRWWKDGWSDM